MAEEKTFNERLSKISGYFTRQDLCIIVVLALLAFLTSSFGLSHVLPGGSAPGLVHGFLKLPGPGAGIFISSAFICLWLVLGLLLIKKPGSAISIGILLFIFMAIGSLALGKSVRLDYLIVMVSIIIEILGLLALEKKPWKYIFPALLVIMGILTLVLMLTGNAKMGENGAAATVFPLGYAVTGILALCLAAICYAYPTAKYIVGAGCSQVFYISFCWMFNGKSGFATWVPVAPAIPALLTFAFVCGAVMAACAYGFYLLWNTYTHYGVNKA